jgi:hypothetical protein
MAKFGYRILEDAEIAKIRNRENGINRKNQNEIKFRKPVRRKLHRFFHAAF